ncbi:unnamed protein product, partial [Acanthocheilonema viteae]
TDMKAPVELMDQLSGTEDLKEIETKAFEDIIPVKEVFEEYGAVISKEPSTEEEHVTDMKAPVELMDQLSRTEDLKEIEIKPFEDIIPVKLKNIEL